MTGTEGESRPRRQRGVRLTDLDRSKVYRIGHTGRRWEVLGEDPAGAVGAEVHAAPDVTAEGRRTGGACPGTAGGGQDPAEGP